MSDVSVEQAMKVITEAMIEDGPLVPGSLAHAWHCNITMMCHDSILDHLADTDSEIARKAGNDAAGRFMRLCFGIDTLGGSDV